jgi:hypothetical protein
MVDGINLIPLEPNRLSSCAEQSRTLPTVSVPGIEPMDTASQRNCMGDLGRRIGIFRLCAFVLVSRKFWGDDNSCKPESSAISWVLSAAVKQ